MSLLHTLRSAGALAWDAARNWARDNVPRLGASLAYYTLFAIAPMLVIAIAVAGLVFGDEAVRGQIVQELDGLIGTAGARAVQTLLEGARDPGRGALAITVGFGTFLVAASGAFLELQHALNTVFRVKADPERSGLSRFVVQRLRSFAMVLSIGFLLLTSLALNAALHATWGWLSTRAWGGAWFWTSADLVLSFIAVTTLFTLIYRFVPDVRLEWRHVWVGGATTAALFVLGKEAIGAYLGRSDWASGYGATGSVLALLIWIYYSAQILLFGAELTRQYVLRGNEVPAPTALSRPDALAHPTAS
jgi:membrane protein